MPSLRWFLGPASLVLLSLLTLGFAAYAWRLGLAGLSGDAAALGRLYSAAYPFANLALVIHMLGGGVITALAPLQVMAALRQRWPKLHRVSGRILLALAGVTAISGLTYIAFEGTVGGTLMSVGFTLYGVLMGVAALQTLRFARQGAFDRHRRWALRLFILAIGSWLYRVHYGLWYALTGGVASNRDFTGLFDHIQVFAFYLPYLALLEIYLRVSKGAVEMNQHKPHRQDHQR